MPEKAEMHGNTPFRFIVYGRNRVEWAEPQKDEVKIFNVYALFSYLTLRTEWHEALQTSAACFLIVTTVTMDFDQINLVAFVLVNGSMVFH